MKTITKKDLQNGDVLHFRNGNTEIFKRLHSEGWITTDRMTWVELNEDLIHKNHIEYDIVKVVRSVTTDETIFDRETTPIPEYTMEEAIEKMGHEFKIKK